MKKNVAIKLLAACCLFYSCKSHKNIAGMQPVNTMQAKAIQTIELPIFIPVTDIQKQLEQSLFAAGKGKYYPCVPPGCDPKFKDIYLENPGIGVNGNIISIKVHVGGNVHLPLLSSDISADIALTARPEVENDTLFFRDVKLEQSSSNLLLNLTSSLFKKTIEQKIEHYAWFSFRPLLELIADQAKKQLPLKWEGAALLLNLNALHLKSVTTQTEPEQGILADFTADLQTEDSSFGR